MSSLVSIRLHDKTYQEMKAKAHISHMSQTDYIRKAIERMNDEMEQLKREERLRQASLRIREGSMEINAEFSQIEHDPKA